jgi:quercetin dioxygenase-like cupin family protein
MRLARLLLISILAAFLAGCASTHHAGAIQQPSTARVAFENEKVRVIEYQTGSSDDICGIGKHTHPAHAYILLEDAKLRVISADGKESIENAKAGEVGWEPAVEHSCKKLSEGNVHCYVIEIKDQDWKPSTGLK